MYGDFNPLMATLKSQSNGPLYRNTPVTGTLAVDGGLLHLVQRGGALAAASTIASEF